ncbi:MAG: hypothetical protein ACR5KX_01715 [Wolbachia sp.]
MHNHKPLIDALSTHYKCDSKTMTFAGIKNFFKVHSGDFKEKLGNGGITLINFVDFGDVAKDILYTKSTGICRICKK